VSLLKDAVVVAAGKAVSTTAAAFQQAIRQEQLGYTTVLAENAILQ